MSTKYIKIPLNLSDPDFLSLAREAHEENITLNHLIERKLSEYIYEQTKQLLDESNSKNKKKQRTSRRA